MADTPSDRVVVVTQFSRLRESRGDAATRPDVDLTYEALAALAESLQLLSQSLLALPGGGAVDRGRLRRLDERVSVLADRVRDPDSGEARDAHASSPSNDSNEPLLLTPVAVP